MTGLVWFIWSSLFGVEGFCRSLGLSGWTEGLQVSAFGSEAIALHGSLPKLRNCREFDFLTDSYRSKSLFELTEYSPKQPRDS